MESNGSSSNKVPLLNESYMAYKTKKAKYYKVYIPFSSYNIYN